MTIELIKITVIALFDAEFSVSIYGHCLTHDLVVLYGKIALHLYQDTR